MKNNSLIFAKPPEDNFSLADGALYHLQDKPSFSEPTEGK